MDGKELYGRELTRSECRNAEEALLILAEKRPGLTSANGKRICNHFAETRTGKKCWPRLALAALLVFTA